MEIVKPYGEIDEDVLRVNKRNTKLMTESRKLYCVNKTLACALFIAMCLTGMATWTTIQFDKKLIRANLVNLDLIEVMDCMNGSSVACTSIEAKRE